MREADLVGDVACVGTDGDSRHGDDDGLIQGHLASLSLAAGLRGTRRNATKQAVSEEITANGKCQNQWATATRSWSSHRGLEVARSAQPDELSDDERCGDGSDDLPAGGQLREEKGAAGRRRQGLDVEVRPGCRGVQASQVALPAVVVQHTDHARVGRARYKRQRRPSDEEVQPAVYRVAPEGQGPAQYAAPDDFQREAEENQRDALQTT